MDQEDEMSRSSQAAENKRKTVEPNKQNFCKSLRVEDSGKIIGLYEDSPFLAQIIYPGEQISHESEEGTSIILSEGKERAIMDICEIAFETAPYDCREFQEGLFVGSCKSMPLRTFRRKGHAVECVGSITDKKQNSENYLAPIQMARTSNKNEMVGGGQKFFSLYDFGKMKSTRVKYFDRINISSVQSLENFNTNIIGSFEGNLYLHDLRDPSIIDLRKPHMDSVTQICQNPQLKHCFVTNARQDDFTYAWDIRKIQQIGKIDTFLECFQVKKYGNQRIGFCFSKDGSKIYSGSEHGLIYSWQLQEMSQIGKKTLAVGSGEMVINSVQALTGSSLIFATGTRNYDEMNERPMNSIGKYVFK